MYSGFCRTTAGQFPENRRTQSTVATGGGRSASCSGPAAADAKYVSGSRSSNG